MFLFFMTEIVGAYGDCLTIEELSNCCPRCLYHFIFPPAVYDHSSVSIFIPLLVIFVFNFSHLCDSEVSHYGSDLLFAND